MPMTPEIVIALLAIAKIGGIILPLFSGYGAGAIVSRMADADAKGILCGRWRLSARQGGRDEIHCG
jgi:acetyl-CoA synthetase